MLRRFYVPKFMIGTHLEANSLLFSGHKTPPPPPELKNRSAKLATQATHVLRIRIRRPIFPLPTHVLIA